MCCSATGRRIRVGQPVSPPAPGGGWGAQPGARGAPLAGGAGARRGGPLRGRGGAAARARRAPPPAGQARLRGRGAGTR